MGHELFHFPGDVLYESLEWGDFWPCTRLGSNHDLSIPWVITAPLKDVFSNAIHEQL